MAGSQIDARSFVGLYARLERSTKPDDRRALAALEGRAFAGQPALLDSFRSHPESRVAVARQLLERVRDAEGLLALIESKGADSAAILSSSRATVSISPQGQVPDPARLVRAAPGWSALSAASQRALSAAIEGATNPYSARVREALAGVLNGEAPGDGQAQAEQLEKLLAEALPWSVSKETALAPTSPLANVTVGPSTPSPYTSFDEPEGWSFMIAGQTTPVTVGHHTFEIVAPDRQPETSREPGMELWTTADLVEALKKLPAEAFTRLKKIQIYPARSSGDAGAAELTGVATARIAWLTTRDGKLRVFPFPAEKKEERRAALPLEMSHELVHLEPFDEEEWRAATVDDAVAPSRYAATAAPEVRMLEDRAETKSLYRRVVDTPLESEYRRLYPHRFALLDADRERS